jgi:hypothetical protein
MLAKDKHSNLLGPFVNYEETKVLFMQPLVFRGRSEAYSRVEQTLDKSGNTCKGQTH